MSPTLTSAALEPSSSSSSRPSISPRLTPTPRPRALETSGTTDLYWGVVHLFREAGAEESSEKDKKKAQDEDDGTVVGMVSVPGVLTAAALLTFISPALESVAQLRMLRDSTPNRSIVLIRFRDAADASQFLIMYNGRAYHDTKDSEVCHVVPISSIKLKSSSVPPFTFPYPTDIEAKSTDVVEIPTCPICLERLDVKVSGLVQILCQHKYHCSCLLKWGDSRCPVCRSTTHSRGRKGTITGPPPLSACAVCQSESNLWICVICGNVGCGRYQGGHAHSHFDESGHSYALEIETGRVWSYRDDEYVHRLIRSRTDGKLVELPSLLGGTGDKEKDKSSGGGGGPDRSTEESQDKLEAMGVEYANLMTSQLESQRGYYEEELARGKEDLTSLRRKWEETLNEKEVWKKEKDELTKRMDSVVVSLEKQRDALQVKLDANTKSAIEEEARRKKDRAELVKTRKELERELEAEREVTKSLTANLGHLRLEMTKREEETTAVRAEVEDMREQMRDVMFALSARDQIEAQGGASEMAGGSVSVPTPPPMTPTSAARRKKKR